MVDRFKEIMQDPFRESFVQLHPGSFREITYHLENNLKAIKQLKHKIAYLQKKRTDFVEDKQLYSALQAKTFEAGIYQDLIHWVDQNLLVLKSQLIAPTINVKTSAKAVKDQSKGIRKEQKAVKRFEDIFHNKKQAKKFIAALKNVDPPVIDKHNNYVLGKHSKSAFSALRFLMRGKTIYLKEDSLAKLLNDKFVGLDVDGRTLRRKDSKAYSFYLKEFSNELKF